MTAREEFEAWWRKIYPHHRREVLAHNVVRPERYALRRVQDAWQAWQASRNAALEEAAKECERHYSYDPEALLIAEGIRRLK